MQNNSYNPPKGLYLLFFVEMWERFSYYGMRALLFLYMVKILAISTQKAGCIYGLYTGLVYLTPIVGGYVADRFLGQRRCITYGAILMCMGLFLLSLNVDYLFYLALGLMVLANGFFKSNISSLLGLLYENRQQEKDRGYTIFYMGINLGALLSPLVCSTIAIKFGINYGFMVAGFGMFLGLVLYKSLEKKFLGQFGLIPVVKEKDNGMIIHLSKVQLKQISALLVLMMFSVIFWICFEQAGTSLTVFANELTDRTINAFTIPTGYFQSLNPLFIIILAPIISKFWKLLQNEPSSVEKFNISLYLMSLAYLIMVFAGSISNSHLVSPLWLILCYFVMTIAELCISPIGLSLVTKLAPKQFLSILMGTWFLSSFLGNLVAGFIGGNVDVLSPTLIFAILSIISLASAVILSLIAKKLDKIISN